MDVLSLCRRAKQNALNDATVEAIAGIFDSVDDPGARIVLLEAEASTLVQDSTWANRPTPTSW